MTLSRIERVVVHASALDASARFYATVLAALGTTPEPARLRVVQAGDDASDASARHLGSSHPHASTLRRSGGAGMDAEHADAGAPGPRPRYLSDYYGAFLLDPDGIGVEEVYGGALPASSPATIDHLWIWA